MIHGIYGPFDSTLAEKVRQFLEAQPYLGPSDLCHIMTHNKSDKGSGWHNYTLLYHWLFGIRQHDVQTVFELGLGTTDTRYAYATPAGTACSSLRGWRSYFPNALCLGADIDPNALLQEERISTFPVDCTNAVSIAALWEAAKAKHGDIRFDLMVDDGMHDFQSNSLFLANSVQMLREGGIYIIEDIVASQSNIDSFNHFLAGFGLEGVLVQIPNPGQNESDNCLAILRKISAS